MMMTIINWSISNYQLNQVLTLIVNFDCDTEFPHQINKVIAFSQKVIYHLHKYSNLIVDGIKL